jgi:hypothetical protein
MKLLKKRLKKSIKKISKMVGNNNCQPFFYTCVYGPWAAVHIWALVPAFCSTPAAALAGGTAVSRAAFRHFQKKSAFSLLMLTQFLSGSY